MTTLTSLETRVDTALDALDNDESKTRYLGALRENLHRIEQKVGNHLKAAVLVALAFELVSRGTVRELPLRPITVTDLELAQKLLPVLLAYLYNQLSSLYSMRISSIRIHDAVVKRLSRPIFDNDLEYFVRPYSWFTAEDAFDRFRQTSLFSRITMPVKLAIVAAPVVFIVYAYVLCLQSFGAGDAMLWTSIVASLIFMVQGMLFFYHSPAHVHAE